MIAFVGIFLFRELWSVEVGTSKVTAVVVVFSVVLAVTWAWFWALVAASDSVLPSGVAVGVMLGSASVLVHVNHIGVFPFYYAVIVAGAAFRWQVGIALVAVVTAVTLAVWWPEGQSNATALQVCGITALLGGAAVTVRRFVGAQVELEETRQELVGLAALEARVQLARDLHDRLGQQLTVSIMQAELLAMDLDAGDVSVARVRSDQVVSASRESLALMRGMVTEMRGPDVRSEITAAQQVLETSGIACTTSVETESIPPSADGVLGWVVREGVTNVLRHSGAATCRIAVRSTSGAVILCIDDDGRGAGGAGDGMGLTHMRERLAGVGGQLWFSDAAGGGCRLAAQVPVPS